MSGSDLVARLESPLPAELPARPGTALFCAGVCDRRIRRLRLLVDGAPHAADVVRGRFWGTVTIPPRDRPGTVELAVAARRASGGEAVAPLGRIALTPVPPPRPAAGSLIAVCMATFEPDMTLFRTQLQSLRDQTDRDWTCVISDDGSAPERFAEIAALVGDDPRFALSRSEERLGFYRNFERALRLAPPQAGLIALCDQDDRWHPDKLAVLRAALGGARMVYSDQRLVDPDGRVLRDTLWRGRANNHTDLVSMLVANSVTGAAALFRREVADLAIPFPDTPGLPFHDHWLGLVALAAGDIAYVDRPLYDYVQHRGAFFGAVTHGAEEPPARRSARAAYFRGYVPRQVLAQVLLVRCGDRLTAPKRRALERFVAAPRSPAAFARLAARPLRVLAGRTDTLGSESELLPGILWRAAARLGLVRDARLPDVLSFQQRRLRRWRARV